MSKSMRAKVRVVSVLRSVGDDGEVSNESVVFQAVSRSDAYPADGADEDNTYARYSPQAQFSITIANPALFGAYAPGQRFYVDFTPVAAPAG